MRKTENIALNNSPIGVFDSGIGGTSIWKEVNSLMPFENTIYLADSKNAPYGVKSRETIIALCEKNTELLLQKNCKIIVVACNTATTNAIGYLREKYPVPFIGIEPAIKPASINSKTKKIGILATKGTLSSSLFHKTAKELSPGIEIIEQHGTGIVELIEGGKLNSPEMIQLLQNYLQPMVNQNIDYLVLGCSHYPYLIPTLHKILPNNVEIIDSGRAVAAQTKKVLEEYNLLKTEGTDIKNLFYTNGNTEVLSTILNKENNVSFLDF